MNYLGLQQLYINFAGTAKKNTSIYLLVLMAIASLALLCSSFYKPIPLTPPLLLLLPFSHLSLCQYGLL